ncbi:MAG: histidine kinase, partial [Bacteroidales bacterium]|nr:histidine kinase [Bacteroidales bacterium]
SQMNPHFIFNSLNSIQNFIIDNDQKNANVYLVIFSKLIRKILEATRVNFVSLREEIETIKLYLELEKFRFSTKFEYNIEISPSLNIDHMAIPSMIIQPYLENAIWHGLIPKGGPGKLDLAFDLTDVGNLLVSITDNGIGREKAAEINKKRKFHKSTGMRNVEERLDLLNRLNRTNSRIEIIDLFNNDSTPAGTRVELFIEV